MIEKRLSWLSIRNRMTLIGVADGDRMNHDVFLAKPVHARAPAIEVVFAVRENHDGPTLGMLLSAKRLAGRVQGSAEVCSSRPDPAGPQPMQAHRAPRPGFRSTGNEARLGRRMPPRPHGWTARVPGR